MPTIPLEEKVSGDLGGQDSVAESAAEPERRMLDFGDAPDGGLEAWLVAAGASCVFFCGLGFANGWGVFQEYYMAHQLHDESADDVAWIGSISAFLSFLAGGVGGPLFDRYGAWVIRPATVIYFFGIMMLSLCHKYWQFMLTQGILLGTTMGFLMFPAMAAVSQYFDKKRAAALGLAVSGSSIGGVVIPIALSKMLNDTSLGFGWSVRIVGFIMLPLLGLACVAIKARLPSRTTEFLIGAAFKELKFTLLIAALFFMFLGMFTPLFFIPTYAVFRGMDPTLASYLLAILNGASTFGRIIPGILADKWGRLNILSTGGIITAITIFCWNKVESTPALVVYSIVFGFSSGTIISGGSAAFAGCVNDPQRLGAYMGSGMAMASLAALIGPPVNGALVDHHGGFYEVSIFSGVMCLVGGCIAIVSKATYPRGMLSRI